MTPELIAEYRQTVQENLHLRAEVERLRALVKQSYLEGFEDFDPRQPISRRWEESESKKALG